MRISRALPVTRRVKKMIAKLMVSVAMQPSEGQSPIENRMVIVM